jgi:hypothetical protein
LATQKNIKKTESITTSLTTKEEKMKQSSWFVEKLLVTNEGSQYWEPWQSANNEAEAFDIMRKLLRTYTGHFRVREDTKK